MTINHQSRTTIQRRGSAQRHHRQAGVTFVTLMLIASVAIFFGLFGFKVGPAYFEYLTVKTVVEETAQQTDLLRGPKAKIYDRIDRGFATNNLWGAKATERITMVKDKTKGAILTIDYENRANLFGNIYVVTKFEHVAGQD